MSETDPAAAKKKRIKVARRRAKVLEMYNRGLTQAEMAEALGVDQSTIFRDILALSTQAVDKINELFDKRLELECARLMSGVEGATRMVWEILDDKDLVPKENGSAIAFAKMLRGKEGIPAGGIWCQRIRRAAQYNDK